MRYNFEICYDADEDDLNSILIKHYGFPLLNFASVIADVLSEKTIFAKKSVSIGNRLAKENLVSINRIKSELVGKLDRYVTKYIPPNSLEKPSAEDNETVIITAFKLGPFIEILDKLRKRFEANIGGSERKNSGILWPDRSKWFRPFSPANQISFIWAQAMWSMTRKQSPRVRDRLQELFDRLYPGKVQIPEKVQIHWSKIINLITWFYERLEKATYANKLCFKRKDEIAGHIRVLKNQYEEIKSEYLWPLMITRLYFNFPPYQNPIWPNKKNEFSRVPEGDPIIAIEFYKNEIKRYIKHKDRVVVNEITFKNGKPVSIVREYYQKEEKIDRRTPLLICDDPENQGTFSPFES